MGVIGNIDMVTETTVKELADAMNASTEAIMKIANKMGAYDLPRSWQEIQTLIRSGRIMQVCPIGTRLQVDKESGVSTTIHGQITAASVDEDTFIATIGHSRTAAYEFIYDGSTWHHNEEEVELSTYGVSYTGTPAENDMIVVHVQSNKIDFDIVANNYHVPANSALTNTITLWSTDLLTYGNIPFCQPQKLVSCREALAVGTYNITLDHGTYGGSTAEDGTYQFTITKSVPAGGGIRHSSMGGWSGSGYSKERITNGTFTTYDAAGEVIESGIACTEGNGGTALGTTTASNPTYKTEAYLNFTERNAYGSNRFAHSVNKEWLNSDAPGAASGQVASWWVKSDEFDMPVKSTMPGFLHGLDPAFREIIQPVRVRTAKCVSEGYGYEDTVESVFLPSMTELGFGKNNNVSETAPKADGTLNTENAWDAFIGATDADRIKTLGGTARYYWLRSPYPSSAYVVRCVDPSGVLSYYSASSAYGVSAGLCLG